MTKRENARRILRFDRPGYVMNELPFYGLSYTGCNHEGYQGGGHDCPVGTRWTDIWGTEWHKEQEGVMAYPRGNPLSSPELLSGYAWPDPNDARICGKIYERYRGHDPAGDCFLAGSNRDTLWEKSYMLVGMENMMAYFYTEPEFAREVLHRVMDFQLGIAEQYIRLGIEAATLSDDLGTQNSLILSPAIIREFLLPEYRRLFDLYKRHGVLIWFHSCGYIEPLIDTFLELGVDVLNPIQATANDLAAIRRKTQGKIALHGGVSSELLRRGPEEAIRAEVRRLLPLLGKEGGYFCDVDQAIPFPRGHVLALYDELERAGRYPLAKYEEEAMGL